jgi:acetate kinase
VILDPLSRFAGCDAEKDNAAATRFVAAIESLLKSPGTPSVLVAHHTSKTSRSKDATAVDESVDDSRGVSALTDGVRWAARLTRLDDLLARFVVRKSNYSLQGTPVMLVRDSVNSGALRAERSDERDARRTREAAQADAAKGPKKRPTAETRMPEL